MKFIRSGNKYSYFSLRWSKRTVFNSFVVERGKTYRFFYKSNNTANRTVNVFLSANFWNG